MTHRSPNLFPRHLDWTEGTCHYVAATRGCRMAYLAGPYRTSEEAHAVLETARDWALRSSGDAAAPCYQYIVFATWNGHIRSILGELRPPGFATGDCCDYDEPA